MTQDKIIESLQKALAQGSGSLDDLSNLLARVQVDIDKAKRDAEEAAKKADAARGEKIAQIATRLLNKELTADDMAFIFNAYFCDGKECWNAQEIAEMKDKADNTKKETEKVANDLNAALQELASSLENIFGNNKTSSAAKATKPSNKKDPDDVIAKFLKDFGLD